MIQSNLWFLYEQMLRSRLFETAVSQLWHDGLISGEMHLGMGEEGIVAGVVCQLQEGDALALDHRGTPPLVMRGVDLTALLQEMLGHVDGLCGGMGGHMHLFSRQHLAASSGIVGASGPAALGFALANQYLRPDKIAVAFFGEGAINQGMLLESFNLAVAWNLPVLFVCKDNEWAISTESVTVRGGHLVKRAQGFGLAAAEVDGSDVTAVWQAAQEAIARARQGDGPAFLHMHCIHLEGHFLGDPLVEMDRHPTKAMLPTVGPLVRSLVKIKGASLKERTDNLKATMMLGRKSQAKVIEEMDPLARTRHQLLAEASRLAALEEAIQVEIEAVVATAVSSGGN